MDFARRRQRLLCSNVVGINEYLGQKRIYTVKNDGTDHLFHDLPTLHQIIYLLKWITDTDFSVVGTWGNNFAIVNFMDTSKPAASYYTFPNGGKYTFQPQGYRVLNLQFLSD